MSESPRLNCFENGSNGYHIKFAVTNEAVGTLHGLKATPASDVLGHNEEYGVLEPHLLV